MLLEGQFHENGVVGPLFGLVVEYVVDVAFVVGSLFHGDSASIGTGCLCDKLL